MRAQPIVGIYGIQNTATGKIYVGSSYDVKHRLASHKSILRKGKGNQHFQNAWDKHGEDSFEFLILEKLRQDITKTQLEFQEQWWMDRYQSYKCDKGFNIRKIATNNKGMKITNTSNMKAATIKRKGKRCILYDSNGDFVKECETQDEAAEFVTGKRQKGAYYGYQSRRHVFYNFYLVPYVEGYSKKFIPDPIKRVDTKEGRERQAESVRRAIKGISKSPETLERMRQAKRKAQGVKIQVLNITTNEIVIFESTPECMEFFNITRSVLKRYIQQEKLFQGIYQFTKL